jgi:hypothetical protein
MEIEARLGITKIEEDTPVTPPVEWPKQNTPSS